MAAKRGTQTQNQQPSRNKRMAKDEMKMSLKK
jgi:hypothetical protein